MAAVTLRNRVVCPLFRLRGVFEQIFIQSCQPRHWSSVQNIHWIETTVRGFMRGSWKPGIVQNNDICFPAKQFCGSKQKRAVRSRWINERQNSFWEGKRQKFCSISKFWHTKNRRRYTQQCTNDIFFLIAYRSYHYAIHNSGSRLNWTFRRRSLYKTGSLLKWNFWRLIGIAQWYERKAFIVV